MSASLTLLIDPDRLSIWESERSAPHLLCAFPATAGGQREFADFVATHNRKRFFVLANLAEESRILETIPPVRGKDRKSLLQRKVSRQIPGCSLVCCESLGLEQGERRNERVLISAFWGPERLVPWLDPFESHEIRLGGIYSVSQLSNALLRYLEDGKEPCLLLTLHGHRLRESLVLDGKIRFTRLADIDQVSIAGNCAEEAEKIRLYLASQRLIEPSQKLKVILLAPEAIGDCTGAFALYGNLNYRIAPKSEVAKSLGLPPQLADTSCDVLFVHLLRKHRPHLQFAGEALRHGDRLYALRRSLLAGASCVLLACLGLAAWQSETGHVAQQETQRLSEEAKALERQYQNFTASVPRTDIPPCVLDRLLQRHNELSQQQQQPNLAWKKLSTKLNQHPEVLLTRLEWEFGQKSPSTAATPTKAEILRMEGHAPYKAFEQFIASLQDEPAQQIRISRWPDRGSTRNSEGGGQTDLSHPFALEILPR